MKVNPKSLQTVIKQFSKNPPNHKNSINGSPFITGQNEQNGINSGKNSRRSTHVENFGRKSNTNTPQNRMKERSPFGSPSNGQILRKEKKFDINDFIVLEDNHDDLCKIIRKTYAYLNQLLKGFGSDELKEYLESLWDIDSTKKEPKDILPLIEVVFTVITKFYRELEEQVHTVSKSNEIKEDSKQARDYLFLLQTQEADSRALRRENQQLKLSIELYQEKLKNSENQADLLASYALKEMENLKQEFQFAINDLKQKEEDVETLKEELNQKNSQLQSMEERLVSVFILEHKIRALGSKNAKDIEKTIFEYTEKLREMDKSSREALRKERQENDSKVFEFKNKVNQLTIENRKLQFENKSRIQQLNDIIKEKDEYLQIKVQEYQNCQEKLAIRNKEMYLIAQQKDKYGQIINDSSMNTTQK